MISSSDTTPPPLYPIPPEVEDTPRTYRSEASKRESSQVNPDSSPLSTGATIDALSKTFTSFKRAAVSVSMPVCACVCVCVCVGREWAMRGGRVICVLCCVVLYGVVLCCVYVCVVCMCVCVLCFCVCVRG